MTSRTSSFEPHTRTLRRREFIGGSLAAIAPSACDPQPGWTLRYRVRIRVFANGQSREGEGVFRTLYRRVPSAHPNQTQFFYAQAWGEAIAIDMGDGRWIFGLLHTVTGIGGDHRFSPLEERLLTQLLSDPSPSVEAFTSGGLYEEARALRGELDLPERSWPIMVSFEDLADSSSIRFMPIATRNYRTLPGTPTQSFASLLGGGARIERITVEMTEQRVSRRLNKILPWLDDVQGAKPGDTVRGSARAPLHRNLQFKNFVMDGDSG